MSSRDPFGQYMRVGVHVKVRHHDSGGGTQTTEGKLLDDDDKGYVVVETDSGEQKYIPKSNVLDITL